MELKPHQQRVVAERDELRERHGKLSEFIRISPVFQGLPQDEQGRLRLQHYYMTGYLQVLDERIEHL